MTLSIATVLSSPRFLGATLNPSSKTWFVYLLRCTDGSIYTGISTNVADRIDKHNAGKGASYTAGRRPVTLLYKEKHPDRGSALRREAAIKKWPKRKKEGLVSGIAQ